MRPLRFVLASVVVWALACGKAAVGYPEWKTVNAPHALEVGTDQALIEALETEIDENTLNMFTRTRASRAEHLLWLLLREGGDKDVDGNWLRNARWDLVARVLRIEPQAAGPLMMRLQATIAGNPHWFGFNTEDVTARDEFFQKELEQIAKACTQCLQNWSTWRDAVVFLNGAAKRGHTETLRTLFETLGPSASSRLCGSEAYGHGPMDSVQPDDTATQEVLASCGARAHSEEEREGLARERRDREREAIRREDEETRRVQREWAEQKEREAEQRRREQASERRQQNERNAEAMRDSWQPGDMPTFTAEEIPDAPDQPEPSERPAPKQPDPPKETKPVVHICVRHPECCDPKKPAGCGRAQ